MNNFFSRRIMKKILIKEPVPIIFPEKRLILLWNAKAGCTFSIKWMFSQMDLLAESQSYDKWVHNYRTKVYYSSIQFKKGINDFLKTPNSYSTLLIVENPFKRALRSYIQACIHNYEDKKLSSFLKRKIDPKNRFSFREFAHYLKNIDLDHCDIHHKLQTSKAERKGYYKALKIIRLNDTMTEIPLYEKTLNLKSVDLQELRDSPHHRPKYKTSKFMGDVVMNEIYKVRNPALPEYKQFYDEEIKEIILNCYREDFERYNFDNKLNLVDINEIQ